MKKREDSGQADSQSALAKPESDVKRGTASVRKTGANTIEVTNSRSLDDMLSDICTPTGTQHDEVAIRIISQVAGSLVQSKGTGADQSLLQAISTIAGLAPQNVTEAMLATQMIATHEASLRFLEIANRSDQTITVGGATMLWAIRLMRLHLDQIEAMQKLKGKAGQQKVTVEHVHVYQGGQAIVGAVAPTGQGAVGDDTENR
jgi:hypothetical protein